jgi:hypothetical protein
MDSNIEKLETFKNRNGFPMIRRCQNCLFWNLDNNNPLLKIGYCTFKPLYFAFTLEPSVFSMTKEFCLCENHKFTNEDKLAQICEKMPLKDVLKKKDDIL